MRIRRLVALVVLTCGVLLATAAPASAGGVNLGSLGLI